MTGTGSLERGRGAAYGLLASVQVALLMAMMVLNVALDEVRHTLSLTAAELALVNAAYPVAFCGLLLLGGRLGDVRGHRVVFLAGCAVFVAASVGAGASVGFGSLLAARFGQGVGAALAAPAALALAGGLFEEPAARRRALAVWGGLPAVGGALGLVTGGPLVAVASWRWVSTVPVLVVAVALAAWRRLPAGRPVAGQRVPVVGALLVTSGLSASCYGLITVTAAPSPGPALAVLLAGAAALAAFATVERRGAQPLVPSGLFGSARRLTGLVALGAGAAGVFTLSYFLPLHLQQREGLGPGLTSAAYLPYAVVLVAVSAGSGRLTARLGPRRALTVGLSSAAAGLAVLSLIALPAAPQVLPLVGTLLFPAGVALVFAAGAVIALDGVPARHAGVAGGLLNAAVETGPTLGFAALVSLAAGASTALGDGGDAAARSLGYGVALAATAAAYLLLAAVAHRTIGPTRS
ncbi:MFS transporter [Streptomyces sp. DSM 44915]|uniref:MFS transporter n=1 Tax=Streptomyces chisholmiae TaxID=3075540 RepID=A0ABU2JVI9_9ACTN|nr:MFS transporter [Streptomyces sp. DSM 44915]MDT0268979.1 MFS transporter [Streptomyces sp. DSM 44915]